VNSRVCQQVHSDSETFTFYYITADRVTLPESLQLLSGAAAGGPISQTPCTGAASAPIVTATVLMDLRGKPTTYRFNGQSFLIQQIDALGQVTTYEREDGTNLLLSVTDPPNRVTRYQYDAELGEASNCVVLRIFPGGIPTPRPGLSPAGRVLSRGGPSGQSGVGTPPGS
jgi:YD repeat-containing protein